MKYYWLLTVESGNCNNILHSERSWKKIEDYSTWLDPEVKECQEIWNILRVWTDFVSDTFKIFELLSIIYKPIEKLKMRWLAYLKEELETWKASYRAEQKVQKGRPGFCYLGFFLKDTKLSREFNFEVFSFLPLKTVIVWLLGIFSSHWNWPAGFQGNYPPCSACPNNVNVKTLGLETF